MDRTRADVRETYDRIGEHFSKTRAYAWPEVESFVENSERGELALDIGCGNGRHVETLQQRAGRVLGVDVSRSLLDTARERVPDAGLLLGDASRLPIASGRVDLAVYVATLHHLPSKEARIASLDELARVLDPDGETVPRFYHIYAPTEFRSDVEASDLSLVECEISSGNCYGTVRSASR